MKTDDARRAIDHLSHPGGNEIEKKKKLWRYHIKCFGFKAQHQWGGDVIIFCFYMLSKVLFDLLTLKSIRIALVINTSDIKFHCNNNLENLFNVIIKWNRKNGLKL